MTQENNTLLPKEVYICTDDVYIYLTHSKNTSNRTTKYIRADLAAPERAEGLADNQRALNYELVYKMAEKYKISYNDLCCEIRAALQQDDGLVKALEIVVNNYTKDAYNGNNFVIEYDAHPGRGEPWRNLSKAFGYLRNYLATRKAKVHG